MKKKFCIIFKQLRGDMYQKELAEELGISRASISHLETGRLEPDLELLEKIADYFNVSVDYLLGRTTDKYFDISKKASASSNIDEPLSQIERLSNEIKSNLNEINHLYNKIKTESKKPKT